MIMITQAVITAGGRGERLRPLTDSMPKVMIPLAGKPLLEHHIEHFKKYGVKEFFLTLYYMPDKITEYFGDGSKWGVKIFYHIEDVPLGDMCGINAFKDKLDERFFFIWGDLYGEVDYSKIDRYFSQLPGAIGIERIEKREYKPEADFVALDETMKMVGIYPKGSVAPSRPVHRLRGSSIFTKRILTSFLRTGNSIKKSF